MDHTTRRGLTLRWGLRTIRTKRIACKRPDTIRRTPQLNQKNSCEERWPTMDHIHTEMRTTRFSVDEAFEKTFKTSLFTSIVTRWICVGSFGWLTSVCVNLLRSVWLETSNRLTYGSVKLSWPAGQLPVGLSCQAVRLKCQAGLGVWTLKSLRCSCLFLQLMAGLTFWFL